MIKFKSIGRCFGDTGWNVRIVMHDNSVVVFPNSDVDRDASGFYLRCSQHNVRLVEAA